MLLGHWEGQSTTSRTVRMAVPRTIFEVIDAFRSYVPFREAEASYVILTYPPGSGGDVVTT